MDRADPRLLAIHPLLLQEAILERSLTGMPLEARLAIVQAVWTASSARDPRNEELLTETVLRAAGRVRKALEQDELVSRPSKVDLEHLLSSELDEVRLVAVLMLSSLKRR